MSLVASWLLFPLVLGLLSLGCGLLVEAAAGMKLPQSLLLPLGFAVIVVVCLFTTALSATARLTTPAIVALAVAGLALALPWRPERGNLWAVGSATATYLAFGAPVILSGTATFAGYITLDDTATWLAFTDRLLDHGRNTTGLPPSSFEAALSVNWPGGYPTGVFPPLGVVHELVGIDSAWLFQPYVAFLGAMLALALYGLVGRVIASLPLRALAAFLAAQPALLYGYSLWGGVKEMASAGIIVLVAALTPRVLERGTRPRNLLPLAMAAAALVGVLNFVGVVWIAPILGIALAVGVVVHRRSFVLLAVSFLALVAVLTIPTLALARSFLHGFTDSSGALTQGSELGNLIHPLSVLQGFGIWPAGDFRLRPDNMRLTYVLIAAVAIAALAGLAWAWKCREWGLLLYLAGAGVGCTVAVAIGSPWIDGKALATASPAALVAGMAGVGWLARGGRRVEGGVVILALAAGVIWSNALAYHDVWLAPRSQLRELETIGHRFSGGGPAFMTEYAPFGVRHFLRNLDPEGASELRRRPDLLVDGQEVPKGGYADIDSFQLSGVMVYRTLVLAHSPSASRPPSVYHLVWSGRYYDVWQRAVAPSSTVLEHVPLGTDLQPAAVPACRDVLRLGGVAAASDGRLATVIRPAVAVVNLASAVLPASWQPVSGDPGAVYPARTGVAESGMSVPVSGRYGFWMAGSFRGRVELWVDGRRLATAQDHLNHPGVDTPLGDADLATGVHDVQLRYSAADLRPGSGGPPFALGPLVMSRFTAELPVSYVQPANARSLCGKSLDWLEAVRG
ncbi:MAG: hypothetical protein QOF83_1086 [Solirubrobacteraceae bacterium]|nr:hypothetical protein [Solirubrobacteraceae bacterium]